MHLGIRGDQKPGPPRVDNVFPLSDSAAPEAVRTELDRLLTSPGLRHSERLCRFLKFAVEQQLAGHAELLKESVLAIEIFDRDPTYDSHVDSVVRVEARRLRDKLDRYYAAEGKEDPIVITLPKGSYAPAFERRASVQTPESVRPGRALRQANLKLIAASVLICGLTAILVTRWDGGRRTTANPLLRALTSDAGLTFQPVLSRDGRLLAYSSDRGGSGGLDIWLQQVSGGAPLRLTDNPADDVEPAFSPDGTMIVYRAEGEMEGIYLMPALGGRRTLLARGGYRPRFSTDGTRVAYWTGERSFRAAKIFVVSSRGGDPVQVVPDFQYAAYPIWSPDGSHIVFVGSRGQMVREESNRDDWDWWIAPVSGGPAVRTSAGKLFEQQGLRPPESGRSHHRIEPECWTASGHLAFAARSGDHTNIWRVRMPPGTWQVAGPAEKLTFGAGREDNPSIAADGSMVFSVLTCKSDVWGLPIHADNAEARGPLIRLAAGEGDYIRPVVSRAGDHLAFLSDRTGNNDVWVKDLKTGRETALTATRQDEVSPILSPDGSTVAFGYSAPLAEAIFVVPFAGGKPTQLCSDCGEPRNWLPGGRGLLYQKLSAKGNSLIGVLELTGHAEPLVQSSDSALFSPSVSPDGRWMALVVRTPPNDHRVTVVPLRNGIAAPKVAWIPVTESGPWVNKPRWAPSGNLLYYVSDRDGFVCIWASRLDPATKQPLGEPKAVVHFHVGRNSLDNVYGLELSVTDDKLVFNLGESSGNIWLAPTGSR